MEEESTERELVGVVGQTDYRGFYSGVVGESEVCGGVEGVEDEVEGVNGWDKEEKVEEMEEWCIHAGSLFSGECEEKGELLHCLV
jgi:hypothetical protein